MLPSGVRRAKALRIGREVRGVAVVNTDRPRVKLNVVREGQRVEIRSTRGRLLFSTRTERRWLLLQDLMVEGDKGTPLGLIRQRVNQKHFRCDGLDASGSTRFSITGESDDPHFFTARQGDAVLALVHLETSATRLEFCEPTLSEADQVLLLAAALLVTRLEAPPQTTARPRRV